MQATSHRRTPARRHARRLAVAAATAALLGSSLAASATVFTVAFHNRQSNINVTAASDTVPVTAARSGGYLNGNHTFNTASGSAGIGVLSNVVTLSRSGSRFGANGRPAATTRAVLDDVVFYDLDDPLATGRTNVTIRASFDATNADTSVAEARVTGGISVRSLQSAGLSFGANSRRRTVGTSGTLADEVVLNTSIALNHLVSVDFSNFIELRLLQAFVPDQRTTATSRMFYPVFELADGIGVRSASYPLAGAAVAGAPSSALLALAGVLLAWRARRAGGDGGPAPFSPT